MFILSGERDEDVIAAFKRYKKYLISVREQFPPNAFKLAYSDWYFNPSDHKCPHDAWLEQAILDEASSGERHEIRHTELKLTLLSAYHDYQIFITYKGVTGLNMHGVGLNKGHGDWRYDEFRISDEGLLVHEIEWRQYKMQSTWTITAEDIEYRTEQIKAK